MSYKTFNLPISHHYRHRPIITDRSAARNHEITTDRTHISRVIPHDSTNRRPFNVGKKSNSKPSPEKLIRHSKECGLGRISPRRNPCSSVLSKINQHKSFVQSIYNSSSGFAKQNQMNSSVVSPTGLASKIYQSSTENISCIHQYSPHSQKTTNQPLVEHRIPLPLRDLRHQSQPNTKSPIPKVDPPTILKSKSPLMMPNDYFKQLTNLKNYIVHLDDYEDEDRQLPMVLDAPFEQYIQRANIKCADWLIKYVFDKNSDENND